VQLLAEQGQVDQLDEHGLELVAGLVALMLAEGGKVRLRGG
jgi:hypothetical protein